VGGGGGGIEPGVGVGVPCAVWAFVVPRIQAQANHKELGANTFKDLKKKTGTGTTYNSGSKATHSSSGRWTQAGRGRAKRGNGGQ